MDEYGKTLERVRDRFSKVRPLLEQSQFRAAAEVTFHALPLLEAVRAGDVKGLFQSSLDMRFIHNSGLVKIRQFAWPSVKARAVIKQNLDPMTVVGKQCTRAELGIVDGSVVTYGHDVLSAAVVEAMDKLCVPRLPEPETIPSKLLTWCRYTHESRDMSWNPGTPPLVPELNDEEQRFFRDEWRNARSFEHTNRRVPATQFFQFDRDPPFGLCDECVERWYPMAWGLPSDAPESPEELQTKRVPQESAAELCLVLDVLFG